MNCKFYGQTYLNFMYFSSRLKKTSNKFIFRTNDLLIITHVYAFSCPKQYNTHHYQPVNAMAFFLGKTGGPSGHKRGVRSYSSPPPSLRSTLETIHANATPHTHTYTLEIFYTNLLIHEIGIFNG